jgi:putative endonuclease
MAKRKFKRSGGFYVYILECGDGTYYTGYTPDLNKRVKSHNDGKGAKYTRARLPVKLAWYKGYKYFKLAFLAEKRIKRLQKYQKKKLIDEIRKESKTFNIGR